MSVPRPRLYLAPRARRDIRQIRLYGRREWGEERSDAYQAALALGLQRLQDFPRIGVPRDDLRPGLRSLRVRDHQLLYRIDADVINVLRVVHVRQDTTAILDDT